MAEALLIKITCRWCGQSFFVCRSCWRGQAYCAEACKVFGYRRNRQQRQRRYRNTSKGRKTHRENENKRRQRKKQKNPPPGKKMGDATSNLLPPLISCPQKFYSDTPCCRFCGKTGLIAARFPRRRYGNTYPDDFDGQIFFPGGLYDSV